MALASEGECQISGIRFTATRATLRPKAPEMDLYRVPHIRHPRFAIYFDGDLFNHTAYRVISLFFSSADAQHRGILRSPLLLVQLS